MITDWEDKELQSCPVWTTCSMGTNTSLQCIVQMLQSHSYNVGVDFGLGCQTSFELQFQFGVWKNPEVWRPPCGCGGDDHLQRGRLRWRVWFHGSINPRTPHLPAHVGSCQSHAGYTHKLSLPHCHFTPNSFKYKRFLGNILKMFFTFSHVDPDYKIPLHKIDCVCLLFLIISNINDIQISLRVLSLKLESYCQILSSTTCGLTIRNKETHHISFPVQSL